MDAALGEMFLWLTLGATGVAWGALEKADERRSLAWERRVREFASALGEGAAAGADGAIERAERAADALTWCRVITDRPRAAGLSAVMSTVLGVLAGFVTGWLWFAPVVAICAWGLGMEAIPVHLRERARVPASRREATQPRSSWPRPG